ncbi:MAG: NAD(P)/FAD-dependent oxidoreductase [Amaricoccus sp.]|uniref:flavin-containing monooxygenase n=1 Tax=Amaricoccus sp. TaxID=1872485 RepID=UPI0039E4A2E5
MSETNQPAPPARKIRDAIVVGTGVGGLYQLYKLREQGFDVLGIEAAETVGGVWHWNRYPGARLDSEAYTYGYAFSKVLLDEWSWSEHFVTQPELQRYFNFVADRLDLRKDISFNTRIASARFNEASTTWTVTATDGREFHARFLCLAVGPLSEPVFPNIPGRESFEGESYHTSRWPTTPVDLEGKRVAVMGTGATGVQVIQEVSKYAKELVVLQRRPHWCSPLNNSPLSESDMEEIRKNYPEIIARCRQTSGWFLHDAPPVDIIGVDEETRNETLGKAYWHGRGMNFRYGTYRDIGSNPEANAIISNFVADRIRERVEDPETAERLIPKDYGYGTRRVPLETKYYETFNKPNVKLVSLLETPIERVTPKGIRTTEREYEFDAIIYATGFDAVTGSYDRIDIRGEGGRALKDKWNDGPITYIGIQVHGFPNMFMVGGPLASIGNFPPALEYSSNLITELLCHARDTGSDRVEATAEAESEWTDLVRGMAEKLLSAKVESWITGVNSNVEGKDKPRVMIFIGSAGDYRKKWQEIQADGYAGFEFLSTQAGRSELAGGA